MAMGPPVGPPGTGARSWVAESTVKVAARMPLKATALVLVKLLPARVTSVPTGPLEGEKLAMKGGPTKMIMVKAVAEEPVPLGVVTEMGPPVAPPGTVAR